MDDGMAGLRMVSKSRTSSLFLLASVILTMGVADGQDEESAEEVFRNHISGPVVQSICVNCHVRDGLSGHTRLVFVRRSASSGPDYERLNLQTFLDFVAGVDGGGGYILNKIQGVSHGGGVQVPLGSAPFADMQRFLGLLGERVATATLTPATLFDTVVLASPRKTLRRAALIFAGRIPTGEEYAAVENGDESALRATIRGLMKGPQFHEFLLRAGNDRLLTNRQAGDLTNNPSFVELWNQGYRLNADVYAGRADERELWLWEASVNHGVRQAPLELIAYVVENDLSYTDILTADYVMANPWAAAGYGAATPFSAPDDVHEFQPSRIAKYYRKGEGFKTQQHPDIAELFRVVDPGPLITDYPHAGILNTISFLNRYPTTATNRNRARARWTYYHFLGVDVEKSASRTTDPLALADTNNPTMRNPACTVCHSVLDPVAGAFQNYSDEGHYKHSWGGVDSLDQFYKAQRESNLAVQGESWASREVLVWPLWLAAGVETLRVVFTNNFYDEDTGEDGRIFLDLLRVTDVDGQVLVSHQFEELGPPVAPWGPCGETRHNPATGRSDHLLMWNGHLDCAFYIDVEVPSDGVYDVEIVAWAPQYQQYGEDAFARLSVVADAYAYHEGDTWYRDMRFPGFAGIEAPHADNSLQWLAERIIADERFAEATVKFWWPAIMGREVAEPPEDESDADFEAGLLAASAQEAEVIRLASGFRNGFGAGLVYNLKDLLVEMVLSNWFRADAITDMNPVRRIALHDAGANRLLTPEELARKTAALTGVQWGRRPALNLPPFDRQPSHLTTRYRLLYGGIDSHSVTERGRDVTSVMAGVAKRHAAEVSCAVVLREFYVLPDAKRRLFAGAAPSREFGARFEIEASSRANREVLSLDGTLAGGRKTLRLTYTNSRPGRIVRLDRIDVRDDARRVVASHEMEAVAEADSDCNGVDGDHFFFGCADSVDVPIDELAAGRYTIEVLAWADQAGIELPNVIITMLNAEASGQGMGAIRDKLVALHDKLFGVQVTPDSPDVEAAYRLFVTVMESRRQTSQDYFPYWSCDWSTDLLFFEDILGGAVVQHDNEGGWQWHEIDWDRVDDFLSHIDFTDRDYMAQAWVVVLAAMMMDYRYLYL